MPRKKKGGGDNVKIFGRVRNLMPWEPRKTSLQVCPGNKLRNKTEKHTNEYQFSKVFGIDINNEQIYQDMVLPMLDNVLKGFNAVLIAYGQTGSGKTFTMLGKPNLGVVGVLPMTLKEFVDTKTVYKLELSAVEAFGHHVAKIELFDLYLPHNQTPNWNDKKGDSSQEMAKAIRKQVTDLDSAYRLIRYAHAASHFAPTGKNPESSRGHVTFVAKVYQEVGDSNDMISFFLFLDCAGSEGESAFTKEFVASIDKTTLLSRRLEAGCINTGLSSLQIIFNELRVKGKLSKMLGNGLRRVLHPFINTRTILAVIFTFSPSVNNAKPTESTLKFAVTAGMVKVQPVKAEISLNVEKLVQQLRKHISENEKSIEEQENQILEKNAQLEALKQELMVAGGDFDSVAQQDQADMAAMGYSGQEASFQSSGNKMKGKDVSHLEKSVLDKLAYLDEDDSDDGFGEMDDMFAISIDDDLEAELNKAFKQSKKEGAGKLLKDAVGVDYVEEKDMDMDDIEAALDDTLAAGDMDVDEVTAQKALMEEMAGDEEQDLDFGAKMDNIEAEIADTFNKINEITAEEQKEMTKAEVENLNAFKEKMTELGFEGNLDELPEDKKRQAENEFLKYELTSKSLKINAHREEQKSLKERQENVVGHLVETNEWLFAALQETLTSKGPSIATAQLKK